ncbi:leptin receptor gene-related protein [Eupeodes corollae]|uniref:leptin receptor gene-related protein n=1 Tax=Eupeodes corollae TaxID=290404 RepID=UPI0024936106|nr:leptin receptor gene-related protein [Eupeodes corollae]
MTFLILACAIPQPKLFYPFFVFIFYLLSIIPLIIARRITPTGETNARTEFALFLAAGFVLSAFALPIVLARSAVITWLACWLTLGGNIINYLTMLGYAMKDSEFEASYGGMF